VKLLYVASDQVVPGRTGGSVHVQEVAAGLAARGHEVHAVVHRERGSQATQRDGAVTYHRIEWWPALGTFRWRARAQVGQLLDALRPDALMERYYNFGGEGVLSAAQRDIPALLEVNSPVRDHPGSWKAALDAALLVRPMRRYREHLCHAASALVAPLLEIVPPFAQPKTELVTWGANVDSFHPGRRSIALRDELGVPRDAVAVVFCGSFRPWHGVAILEAAARRLAARPELYFVLVGGPERGPGVGYRGTRLGRVDHARMPDVLAACDIGVAPYDTRRLSQLRLGFYWSPLKVFEYMASGLPTVTLARAPLTEIARAGQEAVHFREGDADDLARALVALADDAPLRARLGQSARARVVARYSWACHCAQLERVLTRLCARRVA
jgi:glycosyltransferase involved in cell wall biosynthesis